MGRITDKLSQTKAENRAALVTYVMAGDPNLEDSAKILSMLPKRVPILLNLACLLLTLWPMAPLFN